MQRTPDQIRSDRRLNKLHNEQLDGWNCLLNTVRVAAIVQVTSVEWKSNVYTFLMVKEGIERRRHLEDRDVD